MMDPYIRRCRVLRVVDGDTLEVEIDLGFHLRLRECVRLLGVDAPEVKGTARPNGLAAGEFVRLWLLENATLNALTDHCDMFIRTEKDDAFGRWVAELKTADGSCLNADLLASGHAVPWVRK